MLVHDLDILLVEDDPLDAELMMTALKRWKDDTQIRLLTDGVEALDYIFATGPFSDRKIESLPKVIFLDLKLPKLDGLEVLRRIRDDERTREVPVVIFSSSHEDR
ncbi:MAG: response regulator, partial [Bacteroidota bacterium]